MNRYQHQKTRRVAFNSCHGPTHVDLHNLLNILQEMLDSLGYIASGQRSRARSVKCQTTIPAAPSNLRGALNMGVNYDQKEVPIFKIYEGFHKKVLQSLENISIILSTDGKVVFISQNVSPLLGHRPEDIVGKTLLNILLDGEKEEIAQKIILNLPLTKSVGSLIEFCCYVRKRKSGLFTQDAYTYADMYEQRDSYEYVKFTLYLQDSYDESFVIFGNYGCSSRNICSSTPRLLREQQYYLVGTISVLRTKVESEQPAAIQPPVIVIDSDDDNNTQCQRLQKRRKRKKIQRKHQAENVNTESPESSSDVEIVDVTPAPREIPFELAQVRTPSETSICTSMSIATSTSISSSGDFAAITSSLSTSTSGQDSMIEAKNRLDPVDMEFEVGPEFLLSDSQEGQNSPEHGECSDEDGKKPLEEAMGSKPKEHTIDEVSDASSDDDSCVIVEDTEVQKDPKIQKCVVDKEQGHHKTVKTSTQIPSPVAQPVNPEAVVEPMVVTVINDLGPHAFNCFGNGNSEYPRNETHGFWDNHVDHTSPVLHGPSTKSYQTTPVPHQPGAAIHQPLAVTNQSLTGTHHPSARLQYPSPRSHLSTFDYQREGRPHFVPPAQENPRYFHPEEDIDPHP